MNFPYPSLDEFRAMSPDDFETFWRSFAAFNPKSRIAERIYIFENDLEISFELKRAGWIPEPLGVYDSPYQWRWRRPALPGRKTGKLFHSPTQAINALYPARKHEHLQHAHPLLLSS